jgi:hypothetical protein
MLRGFLEFRLSTGAWEETSSLAPLQESELMAVAKGVREGGGWPNCHLAFPRVTVALGDE